MTTWRSRPGSRHGSTAVTHEIHFARDVADRVILMADGVWAEIAPPSELFTNPREECTSQFMAHIL